VEDVKKFKEEVNTFFEALAFVQATECYAKAIQVKEAATKCDEYPDTGS
jgi:hypothetical protein